MLNPFGCSIRLAARRDRQARRGNRSSEILSITLRRATGGERSSEMRRTAHTFQQKSMSVNANWQPLVRNSAPTPSETFDVPTVCWKMHSLCVPLLRNVSELKQSRSDTDPCRKFEAFGRNEIESTDRRAEMPSTRPMSVNANWQPFFRNAGSEAQE